MRTTIRFVLMAVLIAAAWQSLNRPALAGNGFGSCVQPGNSCCTTDGCVPCCTGLCQYGSCQSSSGGCWGDGFSCSTSDDCCYSDCVGGTCGGGGGCSTCIDSGGWCLNQNCPCCKGSCDTGDTGNCVDY